MIDFDLAITTRPTPRGGIERDPGSAAAPCPTKRDTEPRDVFVRASGYEEAKQAKHSDRWNLFICRSLRLGSRHPPPLTRGTLRLYFCGTPCASCRRQSDSQ
jgi:hypothetical protein